MTIYSKTNAGRLMAFGPTPGVPLAMRDLLKRVDGKTPHQQLITHPDDAELFEELVQRQLVQITTEPWRNSAAQSAHAERSSPFSSNPAPAAIQGVEVTPQLRPGIMSRPDSPERNSKIDIIKAQMFAFIQAQLPKHAEATFAEINALTSEAQLLSMLTGYVNLINPTGTLGQEHVQQLLLILAGDTDDAIHANFST